MEPTTAAQASEAWRQALKLRKVLSKQIEKIKVGPNLSRFNEDEFSMLDGAMEKFRLACVSTIFLDFEYAAAQNAEQVLWTMHSSIKSEYRHRIGRLKSSQPVEKRKAEKSYHNFLRIAQQFYKGYIQRLSARYDIKELKSIARSVQHEELESQNAAIAVPADLGRKVLASCHSTLIHLGDLARYRIQARHKKAGFEAALVYYGLAHDLNPGSGHAFHQMGIVNLDQGNHLDVVYHFYRAWVSPNPHPNAKVNLESEFKALELPNSSITAPNAPSTPQRALAMWFVRLHALFYSGQPSAKHEELEGEVMHRLRMAAGDPTSLESLLKMALVSISAYHVATSKFAENQSEPALLFCQYTLRFNANFILTICRVLESALRDSVAQDEDEDERANKCKEIAESNLPLLRIYAVWIATRRHNLFGAPDAFGQVIHMMTQTLARVLTLLCAQVSEKENIKSCPYLLPEDLETRGFLPLGCGNVPQSCRVYCEEDGSCKPRLRSTLDRLDPSRERLARILDILRCAYFVAEDVTVPLAYRVADGVLLFEYQPMMTSSVDMPTLSAAPAQRPDGEVSEGPASDAPGQVLADQAADYGYQASSGASRFPSEDNAHDAPNADGIDHAESTVINMLAPFLRPLTPQNESSYGMHTKTANEIWESLQAQPGPPGAISSRKLEPLPWDWFSAPTPHREQETPTGREAFQRSPSHSSRASFSGRTSVEDPFTNFAHRRSASGANQDVVSSGNDDTRHLTRQTPGQGPMVSTFSHWGHSHEISPLQNRPTSSRQQLSSQGHRQSEAVPLASDVSAFSNMSSLNQGTPVDGVTFPYSGAAQISGYRNEKLQRSQGERRPGIGNFKMDEAASSYDAAVLQSAFYGK